MNPVQNTEPDFQYPLPTRPCTHKQDYTDLIHLVVTYRAAWQIHIDPAGIWVAQGVTDSNRWARFEADTGPHLEELIRLI